MILLFIPAYLLFLSEKIKWDAASLREVPEESGLICWARNVKSAWFEKDSDCPFIPFESGLTSIAFRKTLSRNLRREFTKTTSRLNKSGAHRFRHHVLNNPDDPLMGQIRDIELQSSKAARDIHLVFSPEANFAFQQRLWGCFQRVCSTLI